MTTIRGSECSEVAKNTVTDASMLAYGPPVPAGEPRGIFNDDGAHTVAGNAGKQGFEAWGKREGERVKSFDPENFASKSKNLRRAYEFCWTKCWTFCWTPVRANFHRNPRASHAPKR
jgi:hypothetical protein